MNVVYGVADFEECVSLAKKVGNWEAWSKYREKYQHVLDPVLTLLFPMAPRELRQYVTSLSLDDLARKSREALSGLSALEVHNAIKSTVRYYDIDVDFDVYFLVGLGVVGGTAMPLDPPFLYFGLERFESLDSVQWLIPHELNHLVRFLYMADARATSVRRLTEIPVKELVLAEGLATLSPIVVNGLDITEEWLRKSVEVSEDTWDGLCKNESALEELLDAHWDEPMSEDLISKLYSSDQMIYYIGSRYISRLLLAGDELWELTTMNADAIMEKYRALQRL